MSSKPGVSRWRFVHRGNQAEIIVHDRASAEALSRVLRESQQGDAWVVYPEAETQAPAQPPVEAPAKGKGSEKRKHSRMRVTFRVTVIHEGKQYRSTSSDVSLGGMKLKDPLPPGLEGQLCQVHIEKPDRSATLMFHCRIVGVSAQSARLSFVDRDEKAVKTLKSWLIDSTHSFALPGWMKTA